MSDKTLHPEQELPSKQVTFDEHSMPMTDERDTRLVDQPRNDVEEPCEHCHCPECKHKQVCCWCDFAEREFDEGPEPDDLTGGV